MEYDMSTENIHTGKRLRAERKRRGLVVADLAALFRSVAPPNVAAALPGTRPASTPSARGTGCCGPPR
ncbi:hypothetical protein AGRA3207_002880 [Actinomadura graeca]|uniref:XRE family transcriptional regulator n=1 Tax=Actinomadura graeca TaxID=2750812 RepID=A0ABX8QT85_9ACTN|nr:hypothetical protein [Actinomadura graeca]QXJ21962.1 hypothetical protein AGRA3207_002880 [Actinomadura graeca]